MKSYVNYAQIVTSWAGGHPEIKRAWIFGSYFTGRSTPKSDLDVAIEIDASAYRKYGINIFWVDHHTRLEAELQALVGEVSVQLEMYHRYHGETVYKAINANCIRPIYRRPRGQLMESIPRIATKLR